VGREFEPRNKAQRLAVAAVVAPTLRAATVRTRERRVAVVDKSGAVLRYTTLEATQKALLATARIEFDTVGLRPRLVFCQQCGASVRVPKTGAVPVRCRACGRAKCWKCGVATSSGALSCRNKGRTRVWCAGCYRTRARHRYLCPDCGSPRKHPDSRCRPCWAKQKTKNHQVHCPGCGRALGGRVMLPCQVARRGGRPAMCGRCRPRAKADRCRRGHAYDDANTYLRPGGKRDCRACLAIRARRQR